MNIVPSFAVSIGTELTQNFSFWEADLYPRRSRIFVILFTTFENLCLFRWPLFSFSLGPVYEFVCVSFTTGNLNCFRVKWPWRSTWRMCQNLNPGRKSWKWPRPETAVPT
jgi:hypothetical protein